MMMISNKRRGDHKLDNGTFILTNFQTGVLGTEGSSVKRLKTGAASIPSKEMKKDKMGERIAALQQLVSPFGKTDTASVLEEATGYIKFLHDQLEVLSAPYLRLGPDGNLQDGEYCSLRSRGLCLMPMDSTSKIAQSNGADLWAPANAFKK